MGNILIKGKSIGVTSSTTSFYNSDYNKGKGTWAIGATINPKDRSGKDFLNKMISMSFSDYICTFAMSFRVLSVFKSNTKISEISDMAKSWATYCSSGAYKKY